MPDLIINSRGDTRFVSPHEDPPMPDVLDPTEPPSFEEQVREFARRQEYREKLDISRREVHITTPADRIGLLVLSGDKHIGAEGFAWADWQHQSKIIADTEDCYEGDMGDIIDNLFFGKDENVFNVQEQIDLINAWAKMMVEKDKILFSVGGNHTDWFYRYLGVEFYMLAMGFNGQIPHLRDGGNIVWTYGNVDYRLRVNHRTQYNSDLNPQHTNHRTYWMVAPNADIVASAHSHALANEQWKIVREGMEQDVYFAKTGSMKAKDRYRDSRGHIPQWQTGSACFCVNPRSKELWQVLGIEKGIRLQEMLNWELERNKSLPASVIVKELSEM